MSAVAVALVATALAVAGLVADWPWHAYAPVVFALSGVAVVLALMLPRRRRR